MRRTIPALIFAVAVTGIVLAQRETREAAPASRARFEVRSVFPHEVTPGLYRQVDQAELQALSDQGWELVGVTPYIYRNEERGPELHGPKPVVTQTYPAYFFKRLR